jgi:GDP-4-dehydro-6-deoxy-D-mannose reductase
MIKEKFVISGINGFVGEHLAHYLHDSNYEVTGIGREPSPADNVAPFLDHYQRADLMDKDQVNKLVLKNTKAIIHLAGLASVAESFNKPELYKTGNVIMTENLLRAANNQGFKGRFIAVSTGALYDVSQPMPLSESSATIQSSPYVIGKLNAEDVVKKYRDLGVDAVIARPFNHIGPGQGLGFLVGDLYEELSNLASEGTSQISVGNLATRRDYTDVRDIVKAYALLATAPSLQHSIYNIASGTSYSGFDILNYLKTEMGLESIEPVIDQSRVRPTDAAEITGDPSRIRNELGWVTKSNVQTAIKDFVARKKDLVLS